MLLAATVLYVYFLKLHNNGRLLDTYHRLHGEDDDYVIPFDLEISAKELAHICRKSENWRGNEGETRKTVVNDLSGKKKMMTRMTEGAANHSTRNS
jgi:hypothetical protein